MENYNFSLNENIKKTEINSDNKSNKIENNDIWNC